MTEEDKNDKELMDLLKFLTEDPYAWYGVEYVPTLNEDGNDVGGVYRVKHNETVWNIEPSLLEDYKAEMTK